MSRAIRQVGRFPLSAECDTIRLQISSCGRSSKSSSVLIESKQSWRSLHLHCGALFASWNWFTRYCFEDTLTVGYLIFCFRCGLERLFNRVFFLGSFVEIKVQLAVSTLQLAVGSRLVTSTPASSERCLPLSRLETFSLPPIKVLIAIWRVETLICLWW